MTSLINYCDEDLIFELEDRGFDVYTKQEKWETDSLWDLLVDRFNISRHTSLEKMLDLVKQDLSV